MRVLVIAATALEVGDFDKKDPDVEVLISGVGVPETIYHVQKRLILCKPDFIIQAGIGGGFDTAIELGEVVLVTKDTFGDLGTEEKGDFKSIFQSGFAEKDTYPFTDGWLLNPTRVFSRSSLRSATAVTINKVSDSILQRQQLISNYAPDIESMEGAAFHYVCLQEHVPFIQVRSISNIVGERDKSKWKLKEAVRNLHKELHDVIHLIRERQKIY